jgi:FKBP-type peptidyl-prolyl cis-trans isomerase SlyD
MVSDPERDRIQAKGSHVKIRYRLRTGKGEYIRGDPREGVALLEIYTGYNQLLPGLEKQLVGRSAGETLRIHLPPEEAFGPHREDRVKEKRLDEFPLGQKLQEGKWVEARDEKTRAAYGYFVKKKDHERIVLDYNHPLAGEELIYDLEVVEARPMTEEEKVILRPCEAEGEEGG